MSYKLPRQLAAVLLALVIFISLPAATYAASLQDQYDELSAELKRIEDQRKNAEKIAAEYGNEANDLQSQVASVEAKIGVLDNKIREKQLQIEKLEVSIEIMRDEISKSESIISQHEFDIGKMQTRVDAKIGDMYIDYKTGVGEAVVDSSLDPDVTFKIQEYSAVIANDTLLLVEELDVTVAELNEEKGLLEEQRVELQRDQNQVEEEKVALDSDRADLEIERQAYYALVAEAQSKYDDAARVAGALESKEKEIEDEQAKIYRQIEIESGKVPVGGFVEAGTVIGYQGNSGHSYGSHLHFEVRYNGREYNPCTKLPPGPFSFCKGDGTIERWPLSGGYAFTSSYGWRWGRFHHGIDLSGPHKTNIYAAHDGYLKKWFSRGCYGLSPCNYGGTYIAEICEYANCSQGLRTRYLHLDPSSM